MKYIAFLLLFVSVSFGYEGATLTISGLTTNTANTVVTNGIKSRGNVVSLSFFTQGGSATCTVKTVAGAGLSQAASRTVAGPYVITAESGLVTNILDTVFLQDDILVLDAKRVAPTSGALTVRSIIITKPE